MSLENYSYHDKKTEKTDVNDKIVDEIFVK